MSESFESSSTPRERLADTAGRLGDTLSASIRPVRDLDAAELVQQYPWPALAIAVGAGLLLSASGTDRRTVRAGRNAGRGVARLAGGAVAAVGTAATQARGVPAKVADRLVAVSPPQTRDALRGSAGSVGDVLGDAVRQLKGAVSDVLHARIDEFVGQLRQGVEELGGTRSATASADGAAPRAGGPRIAGGAPREGSLDGGAG